MQFPMTTVKKMHCIHYILNIGVNVTFKILYLVYKKGTQFIRLVVVQISVSNLKFSLNLNSKFF
jgi:predicted transport protein